ncbi:MAG TPA: PQQ-binding-like beta-propeller repeat protein [Pseudobdellovibrionaceae bacterium]
MPTRKKILAVVVFIAFILSIEIAFKSYARQVEVNVVPGDWPGFNGTLDSQRFSPLAEIDQNNIGRLKVRCIFDLKEKLNFQNGPVVSQSVMYITTENDTYAIDAATCKQIWKYHREFKTATNSLHVNRGAFFANEHVYRGSNDGYLIALNAKTGALLWETKVANPDVGESLPAVPVVWNGIVYIGQAGGDNVGVRGRLMAFQESDGKKLWSFELAPITGPGSETWPLSSVQVPRTGAATWTSYTIDEANGFILIPVGNAAPDFVKSVRPGLNLYSDSVVILDAFTGTLKSWYQLTKDDIHDWDVSTVPVLYRASNGHLMMAEAGKDGYLYFVDLDIKSEILAKPTTSHLNEEVPMTVSGTRFCPGTQGGSEWNGAAYHPTLNTLFVPATDWCTTVKLAESGLPAKAIPGEPFTGADPREPFGTMDPKSNWRGWLTAFDANDGNVRWQYQAATPLIAAVTPTAGGLVFTGDLDGNFLALNAETGKVLYQSKIGEPIGGGVISYETNGKQLIAVAAGLQSRTWKTQTHSSRIIVFGLE